MSIKLMSLVFDAGNMTPVHKLVMLALCDYAADDGTSIYPSLDTICRKTALKDSTVRKALRELRDPDGMNLLSVSSKSTNRFPNRYCVNVQVLRSISWVSPGNTQTLSSDIQGVTKKHSRVSPGNTDPSFDPSADPSINGISHPDFDAACDRLKSAYQIDYAQAAPVLIESDDKPYRLHVRLEWLPPDFIDRMAAALREVNPRRSYKITYQTNGTGRAVEQGEREPPAAPDPYAPTDEQLQVWHCILSELSIDVRPNTYKAYIEPARVVSVNGNWMIATPSPEWCKNNIAKSVKRIYRKLTGEVTEFVFVEPRR